MAAQVQQRTILVSILVNQRQNFAWVCITMVTIVICLLTEKKPIRSKPTMKTPAFQHSSV